MQRTAMLIDGALFLARYRTACGHPGRDTGPLRGDRLRPRPMWQGIAPDLHGHIDGLPAACPRPF
jgi:hypothetical protein